MSDYYMEADLRHHKLCFWMQWSNPYIFIQKYVKYLSKGAVWFILFSFIQRLVRRAFCCSFYVASFTVFISLDINECMKWLMNGIYDIAISRYFLFLFAKMFAFTKFCLFIFCLVNFCDDKNIKKIYTQVHKYTHITWQEGGTLDLSKMLFNSILMFARGTFHKLVSFMIFFLIKTEYFCSKIVASSQWQLWFPPRDVLYCEKIVIAKQGYVACSLKL